MKDKENQDLETEVANGIKTARVNAGLSQSELSEKTGIAQCNISQYENGVRKPTLKTVQKIASGMKMQVNVEFVPEEQGKTPL